MNSKEDVWQFEKLEQQLHSFLAEISELSRKKPNDALNKFKLKFINGALENLNKLLGDYRPFPGFELFDLDDLPTNSDAVLILSQYVSATHSLRADQTVDESDDGEWYWIVRGKISDLPTKTPDAFKYHPR